MVGCKQLTVWWHTDDLKISYTDGNEMSKIIQWLESEYGKMHRLRWKGHNYLVTWSYYLVPREVLI